MDEVASVPILAMSLFEKCIARFGFIWIIHIIVYPQFLGPVGKLALLPIWAEPFFGEVFAQTAFYLGLWIFAVIVMAHGWEVEVFGAGKVAILLTLSRGLRFVIREADGRLCKVGVSVDHVSKCNVYKNWL